MKVSIITVTYNDAENLKKTLSALLRQDYPDIESIIVDGGSTDGSIELIKEFEKRFHKKFHREVKWVSEKDNGLYDAANKGIRMAEGELIGCYWDVFASHDVVGRIVKTVEEEKTDGAHGDLIYTNQGKVVRYWKMGRGSIEKGWMPAHPTLYLKKEVYQKYGLYKEKYRCSGDYEFMVRALKGGSVRLSYIPEVLVCMFYGGLSTGGASAYRQSIYESILALRENGVPFPELVTLKRTLRTSMQFLRAGSGKNSLQEALKNQGRKE